MSRGMSSLGMAATRLSAAGRVHESEPLQFAHNTVRILHEFVRSEVIIHLLLCIGLRLQEVKVKHLMQVRPDTHHHPLIYFHPQV